MPRLYLFAVCMSALETVDDHSISLIQLIDEIEVDVQGEPHKGAIPISWVSVMYWELAPHELKEQYEVWLRILFPNGEQSDGHTIPIPLGDRTARIKTSFKNLYVDPPGEYRLRAYLRKANTEGEWALQGEYPFCISHTPPPGSSVSIYSDAPINPPAPVPLHQDNPLDTYLELLPYCL